MLPLLLYVCSSSLSVPNCASGPWTFPRSARARWNSGLRVQCWRRVVHRTYVRTQLLL